MRTPLLLTRLAQLSTRTRSQIRSQIRSQARSQTSRTAPSPPRVGAVLPFPIPAQLPMSGDCGQVQPADGPLAPVRVHSRSSLKNVGIATVAVCALCVVPAPSADAAGARSFTTLAAGLTQELYGTAPTSSLTLAGGLAFAGNGDLLVGECRTEGDLHRFSAPAVVRNGTTLRQERVIPSTVGCGLVNGPGSSVFSNTGRGVVKVDPDTGSILAGPVGPAGNALGIAYDPTGARFVYAGVTGLAWVSADLTASGVLSTTNSYDGVYLDPTGRYLFAADGEGTDILDRTGVRVQRVLSSSGPGGTTDGVAFHATDGYVVTSNHDGTLTRLDFPGGDFTRPPAQSLLASGGFRGDLTQVGADGCLYETQDGARYDDGTVVTTEQSIVRICGGFTPPPAAPPIPPPSTPSTRLVALGDGYASGEGLGGYLPASDATTPANRCHRSTSGYPWLLSAAISQPSLAVPACSHSGIADLFAPNAAGNLGPSGSVEPAQLDAVGPGTSVVTVSFGASDLGLDALVGRCLTVTLDSAATTDPHWRPARRGRPDRWGRQTGRGSQGAGGASGGHQVVHRGPHGSPTTFTTPGCSAGASLETTVADRLAVLAGSGDLGLDHALAAIRRAAPSATIVVTGYPALFGSDCGLPGYCVAGRLSVAGSPGTVVDALIRDPDAGWLDAVVGRLNQVLRGAVARAGSGVVFADAAARFDGHGLCSGPASGSGSWIVPASGTVNPAGDGVRLDPASLHPTSTGQSQGYLPTVRAALP